MGITIFFSILLLGLFPFLSCLFIFKFFREFTESRSYIGLVATQVLALSCSLWGAIYFQEGVALNFSWLNNGEPSGYFRASALFTSPSLIYVAMSQILFLVYILDSRFRGEWQTRNPIEIAFRYLGVIFVALGFLSENMSISIMFFEFALFLSYVAHKPEAVEYYKSNDRLIYTAIGLASLLFVNVFLSLSVDSLIFFASLLYLLAFIFSTRGKVVANFSLDVALPILFFLFLVERTLMVEGLQDSTIRISAFWAVGSMLFSLLAMRCEGRRYSSMFTFWAILFFILFNRFVTAGGGARDWAIFVSAHLVVASLLAIQLANSKLTQKTKLALAVISIFFLFSVCLLRPGFLQIDSPPESWWVLSLRAAASFFLGLGLFRNLFEAEEKDAEGAVDLTYSSIFGFCLYFGAIVFLGLELFYQGLLNRLVDQILISPLSYYPLAFFLGLGLSWLAVRSKSKNFLIARGENSMEKIFPAILPSIEDIFRGLYLAWVSRKRGGLGGLSSWLQLTITKWSESNSLEALASSGFLSVIRRKSNSVFRASSNFHGGKIRVYWMWSSMTMFLIILLSVLLP